MNVHREMSEAETMKKMADIREDIAKLRREIAKLERDKIAIEQAGGYHILFMWVVSRPRIFASRLRRFVMEG